MRGVTPRLRRAWTPHAKFVSNVESRGTRTSGPVKKCAVPENLDLPRGDEPLVVDRDRVYELDGEDSRTLAAVGAFRVVPEHDLDIDHDSLAHLRDEGLVDTVDLGDDERGLTLTREGGNLARLALDGPRRRAVSGVLRGREPRAQSVTTRISMRPTGKKRPGSG